MGKKSITFSRESQTGDLRWWFLINPIPYQGGLSRALAWESRGGYWGNL